MPISRSTTQVEEERADRFPKARAAYVVWTRQQGESLRIIQSQNEQPAEEESNEQSISDKFNG